MNDSSEAMKCPKCSGTMEIGFPIDCGAGASFADQQEWIEGQPEKTLWLAALKTKGKKTFPISMFRCLDCGFLELYAKSKNSFACKGPPGATAPFGP